MTLYSKNAIFLLFIFLMGNSYFVSCNKKEGKTVEEQDINKKPSEEEIKYLIPIGRYQIYVTDLIDYKRKYEIVDGYIEPWVVTSVKILDAKGNIADVKNLVDIVETADMGTMFKFNGNIEGYKVISEHYDIRNVDEFYCTKIIPETIPEDLIFDNNFMIRLYDENDEVISEYVMRNNVNFEKYKKNPKRYITKSNGSTQDVFLIGVLKLPPKEQRENLKYRVVRLHPNGKTYYRERKLAPYSLYKGFNFYQGSGCYSLSRDPDDKKINILIR